MNWTINFTDNSTLLIVTASGEPELAAFQAYFAAVTAHPLWHPQIPALCDFRNLDAYKASNSTIHAIAQFFRENLNALGVHPDVALVVKGPSDYGVARIYEAAAGDFSRCSVFYSVDKALDWLAQYHAGIPATSATLEFKPAQSSI